jgi:glycosyltransferase 2 family protein
MRGFIVKAVLTVAMIAVIVTQINVKAVLERFTTLPLLVILVCLMVAFAQIVLLTYRWSLVCRLTGVTQPFGELLRGMMACQFFSQGLPASIGGDALRIWWLARLGVQVQRATKNVLTDRIAGLISLLALNLFAIPLLLWMIGQSRIAAAIALVLVVGGIGLVAFAGRRGRRLTVWALMRLRRSTIVRRRRTALLRWLVSLQGSVGRLFRPWDGYLVLLWGIAIHLFPILLCLILARQAGYQLAFLQLCAVLPGVMLISYLPISIGSWGVREGGMLVGLGVLGVPPDDAVFVGVALGAFGLASALAGALIWFLTPMPRTPIEQRS